MGLRLNRWSKRRHFWIHVAAGVVALSALVVTVLIPLSFRLRQILNPQVLSLPDLTACTRIEIEYGPSTLEFFFAGSDRRSLLSPDEIEHVRSMDRAVLDDPESFAAIAHEIALASDPVPLAARRTPLRWIQVTCYRGEVHLTSFLTRDGQTVETEDGAEFESRRIGRTLIQLTHQVQPFRRRVACAYRLRAIRRMFDLLPEEGKTYPQPSEWCDVFVRDPRHPVELMESRPVGAEQINGIFMCPNRHEGRCHYAINPHCEPNSPPETVLLFETKAGWNQHGGPELFSFDNHDPIGGCVLFNDRTFKFIRTEDELDALHWK
jgi:hypothetical protein